MLADLCRNISQMTVAESSKFLEISVGLATVPVQGDQATLVKLIEITNGDHLAPIVLYETETVLIWRESLSSGCILFFRSLKKLN